MGSLPFLEYWPLKRAEREKVIMKKINERITQIHWNELT